MEELLNQPEFIRSDRLSAGILNQLFAQAPEVSLLLTPNANAGEFLQTVGRESHRNIQGPTEVRLIANDSLVDRHRLHQLLKALQFIAATGSPATAPFLKFALECVERFSGESIVQDQQPNRRQKKQQGRTAGSVERTRFYSPASRIRSRSYGSTV